MVEPVILLAADSGRMLDALAGDLRRRFGTEYRVLAERSAGAALAALERLADAAEPVALVIAARRMEGLDGLALLVRAHELHPAAKRVLLEHRGEWASGGDAVVRAMTLGQLDYVLFRPWLPLEQFLYLPVSEFLAAWEKSRAPSTEAIQIVGRRWAARSHELRDTLARIGIPYGFYGDDSPEGRRLLEQAGEDGSRLPVVMFRRGLTLVDPTHAELTAALGMRTSPVAGCDILVVGAGPAGLAAAVYAASEGLAAQVLEPAVPGGQAGTSSLIRNYLGFPYGLSGDELTQRAVQQALLFGADLIVAQAATGLRASGPDRLVRLSDGGEVVTRAVILATGVAWRRLGVAALEALNGSGVFYGAAGSEARAMRGEHVFVIGAGNSAGQAAIHLSTYAASVTVVTIDERLGEFMSDYLVQKVRATPNIAVVLHTEVVDGHGRQRLEGLTLRDRHTEATRTVPASAVFVLIGAEPRTDWLDGVVERDERGYVLTGRDLLRDGRLPPGWPLERPPLLLETSLPGVFAAGDVRYRSVKRVASAVGEGAIAVQLVHEYLAEPPGPGG